MKTIHYILVGMLLMGLTACHKAYPGLYAPEIDYDNPNPEVVTDHVPIMLSLYDPLYALVTTRKAGPFEAWGSTEAARKHWQEARFHIYAFLTNNENYSGGADYTAAEAGYSEGVPYCLIRDREAKINNNCELTWTDGEPHYYSALYPEYKFNFFLYHLDDARPWTDDNGAVINDVYEDRTKIIRYIEVDGTQDILSAFAYPDANDRDKLMEYDDESRYLINHWDHLVYSARAGRRRIDPIFKVKHEMTRIKFFLKGMRNNESGEIYVDNVIVTTPYRGEFTVAADWEGVRLDNAEAVPPTGIVWYDTPTKDIYVTNNPHSDFGENWKPENGHIGGEPVRKDEERSIGALLLPPSLSYGITICYRYRDNQYPTSKEMFFKVTYEKVTTGNGGGFQAGNQHEITLQIYGPQLINLMVDNSSIGWMEDNTPTEIGGEGDGDGSTWDYM